MANSNAQEVLRQIAKRLHVSVRKCELYDENVCAFEPDPLNIANIITLEGQPFLKQTTLVRQRQKVRLYANDAFLEVQISRDLHTQISINRPNRNGFLRPAGTFEAGGQSYQLFSEKSALSGEQSAMLDTFLTPLTERLRPAPEESIHVYGNGMSIYLYRPTLERTLQTIDIACSLLELVTQRTPQLTDFNDLPAQFQLLVPLIKTWGISDDAARDELRERTPKATLQRLVDEVKPYYGAINSYLDSLGDHPEPEAATALGALAEFAAETDLYLKEENNQA